MKSILAGAIIMGALLTGLFFLRFWRDTRDRFFLFFAIAFCAEGVERSVQGLNAVTGEQEPLVYLVRFFAYMLILFAIIDKNRKKGTKFKGPQNKDP